MWIKATTTKFNEYGINITTQRQLNDGEYIMHMELTDYPEFFLATRFDVDIKIFSNEEMNELLRLEDLIG